MGQSASLPKQVSTPFSTPKHSIEELSTAELLVLLNAHTWSLESISNKAKKLPPQSPGNFYSQTDSKETDLAMELHALSPALATLRFRLVPSKLKEPVFWMTVFQILQERLEEHNGEKILSDETDTETQPHSDDGLSSASEPTLYYQDLLEERTKEIRKLKLRIKALESQLNNRPAQPSTPSASQSPPANQQGPSHTGSWIMDDDSKDFMSYPPELKQNMRQEKQKRLKQVQQDMKFILDSDRVEDSNGKWDCCGQDSYHGECRKK